MSQDITRAIAPVPEPSPAERAARLFAQAKEAAAEDLQGLTSQIEALHVHARQIAGAGDVYAFGYREICRNLATACSAALDQMRVTDSKVRQE